MAVTTIKSTYSLDPDTVAALEDLARRSGVSKSEALRRAIRAAAAELKPDTSQAVAALDELQESLALTPETARKWARSASSERREWAARSETRG